MAQVITFHVPAGFQPKPLETAPEEWGKLLDFPGGPEMEPWRALVTELQLWADWR